MNQKLNEISGAQRFQTQEPARIEIYGKRSTVYCRMVNLSVTGAYFQIVSSSYTPKAGEFVRITIQLKRINKAYVLNGEVIWCKGLGMGVAFIKQTELIGKFFK